MTGLAVRSWCLAAALSSPAAAQTSGAALSTPRAPLPEVVLSAAVDGLPIRDYGLGEGGVARARGELRTDRAGGGVTPGGVVVDCRREGVKLTFPSGRELLVGRDGALHLRSGEVAGPYPAGVALALADGSRVQVSLAQARKNRVRSVEVVSGDRALSLWRRGSASSTFASPRPWAGVRLDCCGDGGDVYRPMALGALVALERVLVSARRRAVAPKQRLVLLTQPLLESLRRMPRQHRETAQTVRRAVAAIAAVGERGDEIFPHGAGLRRAQRDRARWSLAGGFELELALDGPLWPRLQLFAGRSPLPMVEWTVGVAGAAYLTNPDPDQPGKRWHGNGTRMPRAVPGLQVREHLEERRRVLGLLRNLDKRRG